MYGMAVRRTATRAFARPSSRAIGVVPEMTAANASVAVMSFIGPPTRLASSVESLHCQEHAQLHVRCRETRSLVHLKCARSQSTKRPPSVSQLNVRERTPFRVLVDDRLCNDAARDAHPVARRLVLANVLASSTLARNALETSVTARP